MYIEKESKLWFTIFIKSMQTGAVKTRSVFFQILTKGTPYFVFFLLQTLIYILHQSMQWLMQHNIILNHLITALDCISLYHGDFPAPKDEIQFCCNFPPYNIII